MAGARALSQYAARARARAPTGTRPALGGETGSLAPVRGRGLLRPALTPPLHDGTAPCCASRTQRLRPWVTRPAFLSPDFRSCFTVSGGSCVWKFPHHYEMEKGQCVPLYHARCRLSEEETRSALRFCDLLYFPRHRVRLFYLALFSRPDSPDSQDRKARHGEIRRFLQGHAVWGIQFCT